MIKRITITRAENGSIIECEHDSENGNYVEPIKYIIDDDIDEVKGKIIDEEMEEHEEEGDKKKSFPMNRLKSY